MKILFIIREVVDLMLPSELGGEVIGHEDNGALQLAKKPLGRALSGHTDIRYDLIQNEFRLGRISFTQMSTTIEQVPQEASVKHGRYIL